MSSSDNNDKDSGDRRRGKVTEENLREARLLRAIWDRTKPERLRKGWGTQDSFGHEFGIGNQAAVGHFLNGTTALSMKAALGFARGLGWRASSAAPRIHRGKFFAFIY